MSDSLSAPFALANKPSVPLGNPLEYANQAGSLAEKLNANRLFQAQTMRGQLLQQATGPDGNVDMPTFNRLAAAAGPGYAPAAAAGVSQSTAIAGEQQAQNATRNAYLGQQLGALLDLPDGQLNHGLAATAGRIRDSRMFPLGEIDTVLSHLPSDPAALRSQLRQVQLGLQGPGAQEGQIYGTRPQVDTGSTVDFPVVPSAAKGGPVPSIPLQTGPGVRAAETPVFKRMADGTVQQVLEPRSARPGASGAATNYAGQPNPLLGGLPNPQEGQQSLSAPPQGQPEALAADVGKFKQDQFAIPQGQQNVQSLQKAQLALEASNTGRSSEGVHNMLATMQTLGIPTLGLADSVASYDLAHKYLLDYARKSGAAAHSDLQLQSSEGANASTGINQQAALDVVHTNIGRERQAIAQNMEAPQNGIGYGDHSSKFSTASDPRGFALDAYKPADLNPNDPKSMVGKMTPAERAKFYKSAGIAQRLGLLNTRAP